MKRGDWLWLVAFAGWSSLLLMPATHQTFVKATQAHPYGMGFIKFAILATMGELLALRILAGRWNKPAGMLQKAVIWGLFGIGIVLMFDIYLNGVSGAVEKGLLYAGEGSVRRFLTAFYISTIMNLTFAPAFMALHRMTDLYVDMKCDGRQPSLPAIIAGIDWQGFVRFVIFKTIPFFWIPAHTFTFMLPPEYRVLSAAYLSIALGAILSYARRR